MVYTCSDTGAHADADARDIAVLVNEEEGWASHRIFTDPDIYALEVERVFNRCWLFLAHDTEIPHPGDYVLRRMSDEQVLVMRGEDGTVRAFLNSCRHRGAAGCWQYWSV